MRRTEAPLFARQPPLNGRRASSSCLAVAGRLGARSPLTVPAPAALPWLRGGRARTSSLPAGRRPESPHLRARCSGGADLERARGGRRGGACAAAACTARTRAAARARIGAGSRLAAWSARPFKFLSHSAAAKRAQSEDWHVARGRSASPRRRSWPPARAQRPRHSRSASRRRSASERANSHCAARYTREPKSRLEKTYVLGRPTMKMKPMLGDETGARIPGASFAAVCCAGIKKLSH